MKMFAGTAGIVDRGALLSARAELNKRKWYCVCMMENGREGIIKMKAASDSEASSKVHELFKGVEYILEVLTHEEMERRKKPLRKHIAAGISVY